MKPVLQPTIGGRPLEILQWHEGDIIQSLDVPEIATSIGVQAFAYLIRHVDIPHLKNGAQLVVVSNKQIELSTFPIPAVKKMDFETHYGFPIPVYETLIPFDEVQLAIGQARADASKRKTKVKKKTIIIETQMTRKDNLIENLKMQLEAMGNTEHV
jgi:hypothetical protein